MCEIKPLTDMELLRGGSRLSAQPEQKMEFDVIVQCAGKRGL